MSMPQLGFMQGRLSSQLDGKIQCFPWPNWQKEFSEANRIKIRTMEWTLDQERLNLNPIMTTKGRTEISKLRKNHHISIPSLTGDCFMQAPFFKTSKDEKTELLANVKSIIESCSIAGVKILVFPIVDDGSVETLEQEAILTDELLGLSNFLRLKGVQIAFESDFAPQKLGKFIERFPIESFGVNYDTGNSAAAGYSPVEEFTCFGRRVINVHLKDRILNGHTVPFGDGATNFETVFDQLNNCDYRGNFILQGARALDDNHAATLCRYVSFVNRCWKNVGPKT